MKPIHLFTKLSHLSQLLLLRIFLLSIYDYQSLHHRLESARLFAERGIPTRVILDAAVGAIMEEVDLCLVGAEGVMENGGIVNKVGNCTC